MYDNVEKLEANTILNNAFEYFLYHANKQKLLFSSPDGPKKLVEVLNCKDRLFKTAIELAVQHHNYELFNILVRYGVDFYSKYVVSTFFSD